MTNPRTCAILYLTFKLNVKYTERSRSKSGLQQTLQAISDPTRREILALLQSGRLPAGKIASRFDISGAAISRHLSILREADLIRDTREGKFIYYELNTSVLEDIIVWVTEIGKSNESGGQSYSDCQSDSGYQSNSDCQEK